MRRHVAETLSLDLEVSLLEETIEPRRDLPPLLVHVRDRRPEQLHYLGVSFGLTRDLFRFWRRHKFAPFYIGQVPSSATGEHTCMVLKPLSNDDIELGDSDKWGFFHPFYQDFRQRFARLLGSSFRAMDYKLAMSILDPKTSFAEMESHDKFLKSLDELLTPYDIKRLESYTNNLADFHLILDLVPVLSDLYFQEKLPVGISCTHASVLLCMGLQYQNVSYIEILGTGYYTTHRLICSPEQTNTSHQNLESVANRRNYPMECNGGSSVNLVESYSAFADKLNSVHPCLKKNFPCSAKDSHYYSLHIDCGGNGAMVNDTKYEADWDRRGASTYNSGKTGHLDRELHGRRH